ncbi:DUF6531 domain-containing protein [Apibacter mensalis]|uniref:DUF6531 domain-containing protein n=1 Tax=Apibacter mensalis TaxID=1586267 RepID=UPI0026EE91FA|nr:DUF6531 domain-containing protein [Apibacter mensalis]
MSKLYVPEGIFLACNKGSSPSNLRVSHNENTTIRSHPMATEADKYPFFNIKPMGICINKCGSCIPIVLKWDNTKEGVKINGNRMLLQDSTCQCLRGGKITIHENKDSAIKYGVGNGKKPSDYIKSGFDWLAEKNNNDRKKRDSWLPDWMKPAAHVVDWFEDLSTGLVEGVANGIVGCGELIYNVAQDPVGTCEALWGATKNVYNATIDGASKAWDWASDKQNWKNAADATWDWASKGENWKNAASNAWEGTKNTAEWIANNPRKIGSTIGEFIPDIAAVVLTGGVAFFEILAKSGLLGLTKIVITSTVKNLTNKIRYIGKVITTPAKNFPKFIDEILLSLRNPKSICKNDPVDPITGNVFYSYTDFELPGPIPLKWKREYNSGSKYKGILGYGVSSIFDLHLSVSPNKNKIKINLANGNIAYFSYPKEDEFRYHASAKLRLNLKNDVFTLFDFQNRWLYTFCEQDPGNFKPIKIEDERGFVIQLFYQNSKLYQIIDSRNQILKVVSDNKKRVTNISLLTPNEDRLLVEYEYDVEGNMCAAYDSLKQKTSMKYDANHRMIQKTDRNGISFYWKYNSIGKCIHTWGDGGLQEGFFEYFPGKTLYKDSTHISEVFLYDNQQRNIKKIDALGNSILYEFDKFYNLVRETNEEGLQTNYTYDDIGNLIMTTLPDERTYNYVYDDEYRLILITDPSGNHEMWYYQNNLLIRTVTDNKSTYFKYNENNLISSIKNDFDEEIFLSYDEYYNLTQLISPQNQKTEWKYNSFGECIEVINPLGKKQKFNYDRLGRVTKIYQSNSEIVDLKYDAYDSILQVNSLYSKINYTYTPLGSIKSREEKGVKVFFEYDVQERLTALSNEKGEKYRFLRNQRGDIVREISFDGISRYYKRDKSGKVIRIQRGDKRYSEFQYDLSGRIIRAEYYDGSWETFAYDKGGRIIEACNEQTCVSFKRNRQGKILQEIQGDHSLDYLYDKMGNLIQIKSSLGACVNYTRNTLGEISHIHAEKEFAPWTSKIKRNMLGLEIERSLPGGVKSSWSYDDNFIPISQKITTFGMKTVLNKQYHWNASQQLQRITNLLAKNEINFAYDAFGNLASAQYEDGSYNYKLPDEMGNLFRESTRSEQKYGKAGKLTQDKNIYLHYDEEGNLILKTKRKNPKINEIYSAEKDKNNFWINDNEDNYKYSFWINDSVSQKPKYDNIFDEKAEIRSYSKKELKQYDLLRHKGKRDNIFNNNWEEGDWYYEWYANGMLKSVRKPDGDIISFEYDALGRRTAKIIGNHKIYRYIWDGNVLLHEWNYNLENSPKLLSDVKGNVRYEHDEPIENLITWVYEEGSLVPTAKLCEDKSYSIVSDYLGRPAQAYDDKGELVWQVEFDIYGRIRENLFNNKSFIPFRQLGQYEDVETGLYYNRFRYYDSNTGTYISQDPIGLAGNNPNFYAYVHDSNAWMDPFGLSNHPSSYITFTDSKGLSLTVNGYTNISHLSNRELDALYYANSGSGWGLSPKDKKGNTIVLHHYKQDPEGIIVAMPQKHHDKPHTNPGQHPYGKKKGGGLTVDERAAFDNWRKEYHAYLAKKELEARGIKVKCK